MFLKNKKADITITILVIGIIALCFLTIFSFIHANSITLDNLYGVGLLETMNSINLENNLANFQRDYGNSFEDGNVKITIDDNFINGTYTMFKPNYINSCDGKSLALFKKCPVLLVKIINKK